MIIHNQSLPLLQGWFVVDQSKLYCLYLLEAGETTFRDYNESVLYNVEVYIILER